MKGPLFKMKPIALAFSLGMAPSWLAAQDYRIGDLAVDHPVAFETSKTAMAGAGYLMITNTGDSADTLIAVEADFPRVMVHDTQFQNDVATMVHLDRLKIAPGDTVMFEPGGKHVMFMGLNGDPFEIGETVSATLVFENAGRLDIAFNVEAMPDSTNHNH